MGLPWRVVRDSDRHPLEQSYWLDSLARERIAPGLLLLLLAYRAWYLPGRILSLPSLLLAKFSHPALIKVQE